MVRRHILQPSRCIYSTDVPVTASSADPNVDRVSVYLTPAPVGSSARVSATSEVSGKCGEVCEEDPVRLIPSRLRSLLARHELDLRHQVGRTLRYNISVACSFL